jgi:hypothetical protein
MRRILLGALAGLAACGPAASTAGGGTRTPTQVISTGDAIHVATSNEVRVISQTVDAPVDRVWAALPAVFQELGLDGDPDASTRSVAGTATINRRFQGQQATRLFDCGMGQFGTQIAASYTIRVAVATTVNPSSEGGSRLDTMVEANARSSDGANSVAANCRTQGQLEAMIVERVRQKVAG